MVHLRNGDRLAFPLQKQTIFIRNNYYLGKPLIRENEAKIFKAKRTANIVENIVH